jgi:hypothetical protein
MPLLVSSSPPVVVGNREVTLENLRALVEALVPQGGGGFDVTVLSDLNSYQSRALVRILDQDNLDTMDYILVLQHWVLYCLYFSTGGDGGEEASSSLTTNDDEEENTTSSPRPPPLGWKRTDGWKDSGRYPCGGGGGGGGGW